MHEIPPYTIPEADADLWHCGVVDSESERQLAIAVQSVHDWRLDWRRKLVRLIRREQKP